MSSFWHWWVVLLTLGNIVFIAWLIRYTARRNPGEPAEGETTGHVYDGDLTEYNRPMPRWWLWMFWATIVFALVYLVLFPGLGNYSGVLGWSSTAQYEREVEQVEERLAPIFERYAAMEIDQLQEDSQAMATARRIFGNECAVCHGGDGGGTVGFPALNDGYFQWGGSFEEIQETIAGGRQANMPSHTGLDDEQLDALVAYVFNLADRDVPDPDLIPKGEELWDQQGCFACHGDDGTGMTALGAPDLTRGVYIYGGSAQAIRETIRDGREGEMPAFADRLGEDRVRLLSAYILQLSQ